MAEIFGAVAAGITICHELSQLAGIIRKAIKTVQTARNDIAELLDEAIIFTSLYGAFLRTCDGSSEFCTKTASSIERLKTWTQRTIKNFQELLAEVDALRLDTKYRYSLVKTCKAQMKWLFSTNTVKLLHASLSIATQNIIGFSNIMCLEKLKEELDMLRNALANPSERRIAEQKFGMRLEDKIQSVEQLVDVGQTAHLANIRQLKEKVVKMERLQSKGSTSSTAAPETTDLFEIAEALDTYTEQGFSPRPSNERGVGRSVSSRSSPNSRGSSEGLPRMMQPDQSPRSFSSSPTGTHFDPLSPTSSFERTSTALNQSIARRHGVRPTMIPIRSEAVQTATNNTHERPEASHQIHEVSRSDGASRSPLRTNQNSRGEVKIGRHTISLSYQKFRINTYTWHVANYTAAVLFFDDLLRYRDRLDQLDRALTERDPESEWLGIPGWRVRSTGISRWPEDPNVRDV